jgi:hypothetical protein
MHLGDSWRPAGQGYGYFRLVFAIAASTNIKL